ncbi:unnamed protein product [Ceutorhynchus assimilis]|uniref:Poly(A) RNA polymerase, mitochondrial n=1 Tax=Ceutorhynchus assimilis TaxID=467358 RepID=A0A9N9MLK6_9CUCU|nr:unnamed protein product [Ceutorhynchus assimilis]
MVLLYRNAANFIRMGHSVGFSLFEKSKFYGKKYYCQQVSKEQNTFIPFLDMIESRREQAARSILVQVQSEQSYKQLFTYCESIGKVKNMFHYSEGPEPLHFIIVEFASDVDIKNVFAASTHIQENQSIPATSHFLWFRAASKKLGRLKQDKNARLSAEHATQLISETDLCRELAQCETVSNQIDKLYDLTRLNEVGQRLRFLTAKQVESTVSGLFPNICAYPFGSSVNGFGKMSCDLDLVVRLTQDKENDNSRLIYHCKAASGTERSTAQRNMETIGDLIHLFLPGCSQVRRILQARVPIIKYHQQFTNVECDLSMSNMSGVYMSDFLYLMGEIDPRVRPLLFTIRKWAKEVFLTNHSPGKWITNFSLTLLALAFLQKPLRSPAVLPTLNQLVKSAGPYDNYVTEDGINGTFLRDIKKLHFERQNTSSLHSLLFEFFEYYAQFDFMNKAICLNEAVAIAKPEYSPLYIVNPLEKGLNVSKNVSMEELERFKIEIRNAAWILESQESNVGDKGLLSIFETKNNLKQKLNLSFSPKHNRLLEVNALFDEDEEKKIEFKNVAVEKEVAKIKKETKENIKSIDKRQTRQKLER